MRDKVPTIISTIKNADRPLLLSGFFIYISAIFIIALRLRKVISVQSISLSVKEAIYLTFTGFFFNNFMPTSFGGDVVKAYYAGKKSNKKAGAFAGVFMDRVLAMIPFTLIPVFTITFFAHSIDNKLLIAIVYLIFAGCILFLWLLLHRSTAKYLAFILEPFKEKIWYEKIKSGYSFFNLYAKHKLVLSWSFGLSVISQVLCIVSTYLFAKALGIDYVSIGIFFVIVPIVWTMTLLPSLNGLGIREGGFVYLLKAYMPPDKAFAVSILVLATLLIFGIIGGIIYMFKRSLFAFKAEEIE